VTIEASEDRELGCPSVAQYTPSEDARFRTPESSAMLSNCMERVAWVPAWYGDDQSLAVGQTDEFLFWRVVPEELRGPEPLVLYSFSGQPGDFIAASGTVLAISNPELGDIREVDTRSRRLAYVIHLADGTTLEVDTEEEPGRLFDSSGWSSRIVNDWRLSVEFDSLSELRPEADTSRTA
jgi:hypothetical protein